MKKLITLALSAFLFTNVMATETKKVPAKKEEAVPAAKPKVKRPCKPGQTEKKDGCHEVKKLK
jgi:hypothetical protein